MWSTSCDEACCVKSVTLSRENYIRSSETLHPRHSDLVPQSVGDVVHFGDLTGLLCGAAMVPLQ